MCNVCLLELIQTGLDEIGELPQPRPLHMHVSRPRKLKNLTAEAITAAKTAQQTQVSAAVGEALQV